MHEAATWKKGALVGRRRRSFLRTELCVGTGSPSSPGRGCAAPVTRGEMTTWATSSTEWPDGLGAVSKFALHGTDLARLRRECTARSVGWSLGLGWHALQVRLALRDAIDGALRTNNVEPLLSSLGGACIVRGAWLQHRDSIDGVLMASTEDLEEGIVPISRLRELHQQFGADALPVVTLVELWQGGGSTEIAWEVLSLTLSAVADVHAADDDDDDDDTAQMRLSGLPDVCIALPWAVFPRAAQHAMPSPPTQHTVPSTPSERPMPSTPAPQGAQTRPVPTSLGELRSLCSAMQIDWSITDNAAQLSQRLDNRGTRVERRRRAEKGRAANEHAMWEEERDAAVKKAMEAAAEQDAAERLALNEARRVQYEIDKAAREVRMAEAHREAAAATRLQSSYRGHCARHIRPPQATGDGMAETASVVASNPGHQVRMRRLPPGLNKAGVNTAGVNTGGLDTGGSEAATRVQASYRGHKARVRRAPPGLNKQASVAATRVQASYRGHKARRVQRRAPGLNQETSAAATRVQASYRGHKARRVRRSPSPGLKSHESMAATRVQASYRGHQARVRRPEAPVEAGHESGALGEKAAAAPHRPSARHTQMQLSTERWTVGITSSSVMPSRVIWIDSEEEAEAEDEEEAADPDEPEEACAWRQHKTATDVEPPPSGD